MDWGNLSGILTAFLGIVVIVVGGAAALQYGTVKVLRETASDLRARVEDLEKSRTKDRAENAQLIADRDALSRVVTGEAHWVALGEQLDAHHREAVEHWKTDEETLVEIRDALRKRP